MKIVVAVLWHCGKMALSAKHNTPNTMKNLFNITDASGKIIYANVQRSSWHAGYDWDYAGRFFGHVTDSIIRFSGWKVVDA